MYRGGLTACSDSDSSDDKSGPSQIVENPPVITPSETEEQKSLYGTYWGSLTVAGKSYDMALVANGTTAALYSTMMTQSYPVVKYVKNADGTYTLHCYNSGEDTTADSTHVKVTFTLGENGSVTCVPLIVPMAAMAQFSTCTKGNAYNGEYDQGQGGQPGQGGQQGQQGGETTYPDVAQDTLYGSYWGEMMGFGCCAVIKVDSLTIYSDMMGAEYSTVKFKKSVDTNQWTMEGYKEGRTSPAMIVVFDTSVTPYTAVATIVAMGTDTSIMPKGDNYTGVYANPPFGESVSDKTMTSAFETTASEAADKIKTVTENTTVKVTGTLDTDTISAIAAAINTLPSTVFVNLDLSETTGLTEIPSRCFIGVTSLAGLTLPPSVTKIRQYSLYGTGIDTFVIPDTVTTLEKYALNGIKNITIGSGITTITRSCFEDDSALEEIRIPDTVTSIQACAFVNCVNLKTVYIGKGVQTIKDAYGTSNGIFRCTTTNHLENIFVDPDNQYFEDDNGILYTKGKTKLLHYPIDNKTENLVIPDSCTEIANDNHAFAMRENLKTITIGSGLTTFTAGSLGRFSALENITVSSANETYKSVDGIWMSKDGTKIVLYPAKKSGITYVMSNDVVEIEKQAFACNQNLQSVTFSSNLKKTGIGIFNKATGLKSITLPDSLTDMQGAFCWECTSLETAVIGNEIETLGVTMFKGCTNLKSVTIGSKVTTIGNMDFQDCPVLTEITIPASVTKIGQNAFAGSDGLTKITFEDSTSVWNATTNSKYNGGSEIGAFNNTSENVTKLRTTYATQYLYKVSE
nr:leucine-rich repeat domain-containing protein [uncultured Treponema sp.]